MKELREMIKETVWDSKRDSIFRGEPFCDNGVYDIVDGDTAIIKSKGGERINVDSKDIARCPYPNILFKNNTIIYLNDSSDLEKKILMCQGYLHINAFNKHTNLINVTINSETLSVEMGKGFMMDRSRVNVDSIDIRGNMFTFPEFPDLRGGSILYIRSEKPTDTHINAMNLSSGRIMEFIKEKGVTKLFNVPKDIKAFCVGCVVNQGNGRLNIYRKDTLQYKYNKKEGSGYLYIDKNWVVVQDDRVL